MIARYVLAVFAATLFLGCLGVQDGDDGGSFSTYVAVLETKNFGNCGRIESEADRETCYVNFASARGDVSICPKLGDDMAVDACVAATAHETRNTNMCYKIKDEDVKLYCIAVVKRAKRYCMQLTDDGLRKLCLANTAVKTMDPSLCAGLPGEAECTAVASRDPIMCQKLPTRRDREFCRTRIAVEKGDSSVCSSVEQPVFRRYCRAQVNLSR